MSHYKPYPAYKDSGVEWLGRVPEHWESARFDAKTTTHRDSIEAGRLNGMRVLHYSIPAVQEFGCAQEEDGSEIDSNKLVVGQRQLLVSKLNPHKQTLVVADRSDSLLAVASTEFVPLIPVSADLGYITYVWSSAYCQHYLLARCESSTRSHQRVAPSDITRMPWAWPDLEEQAAIVSALDRETARIDALVAKKTRFIELLREKRQALIIHTVTKGLDPNVKMKDSGVEWLGEVPEHWAIKRLQFLCSSIKAGPFGSALTKDMYVSDGYRVYGQEQVIPGDFSIGDYYITPEYFSELAQYAVQPGDVLVSCVGTFGKIAVVPEGVEPGIINPRLIRIRVNQLVSPVYLTMLMRSSVVFEQFSLWSRGGTMDVINIGTLSGIVLSVPPASEQQAIIRYVEHEAGRIDALVNKTERSIELLKERRSALITAAVTGQIDLREAV